MVALRPSGDDHVSVVIVEHSTSLFIYFLFIFLVSLSVSSSGQTKVKKKTNVRYTLALQVESIGLLTLCPSSEIDSGKKQSALANSIDIEKEKGCPPCLSTLWWEFFRFLRVFLACSNVGVADES